MDAQPAAVSDEDLERSLESLRRETAALVPVDRPIELGDVPTLDYEGRIDDVPFEGGAASNQPVELSKSASFPASRAGLSACAPARQRLVEAHLPRRLFQRRAGRQKGHVHGEGPRKQSPRDTRVGRRVRPALRRRRRVAARPARRHAPPAEASALGQAQRRRTSQVMEQLLAAHEFALPAVMVDRESEHLEREMRSQIERAGLTWDGYLEQQGKDRRGNCAASTAPKRSAASSRPHCSRRSPNARTSKRPPRTSRPKSHRSAGNTASRGRPSFKCFGPTWARWSTGSCAARPSTSWLRARGRRTRRLKQLPALRRSQGREHFSFRSGW